MGANYDEKVDMYSLGTVLFDMWWDWGKPIFLRSILIKKILQEQRFDDEINEFIHDQVSHVQNARNLILKLVNKNPKERLTAFQLLSSDLIPSAVLSDELLVSLSGASQS